MPIEKALGVSIEKVIGGPKLRSIPPASGRMERILEAASRLPRRQQQKIIDIAEAYIAQYEQSHLQKHAVA